MTARPANINGEATRLPAAEDLSAGQIGSGGLGMKVQELAFDARVAYNCPVAFKTEQQNTCK